MIDILEGRPFPVTTFFKLNKDQMFKGTPSGL